jgi:hypothetical protein
VSECLLFLHTRGGGGAAAAALREPVVSGLVRGAAAGAQGWPGCLVRVGQGSASRAQSGGSVGRSLVLSDFDGVGELQENP